MHAVNFICCYCLYYTCQVEEQYVQEHLPSVLWRIGNSCCTPWWQKHHSLLVLMLNAHVLLVLPSSSS